MSRKTHPVLLPLNNRLWDLPTPPNLRINWNWGSLLGVVIGSQLLTGLFLACNYSTSIQDTYEVIFLSSKYTKIGWFLRRVHSNGASFFFVLLYLHLVRGVRNSSYTQRHLWIRGVRLLLLSIAIAFLGYVLVWGQMSYWGASVITNLLSAVPYCGGTLVSWLWGAPRVSGPTLNRFFALHFAIPFLMAGLVLVHLVLLHRRGSSNPIGICIKSGVRFHPYYTTKDTIGLVIILGLLIGWRVVFPDELGDPLNYSPADPIVAPLHIKPEWYFLWSYAILRSVPNKLGGVFAMFVSLAYLYLYSHYPVPLVYSLNYSPLHKISFFILLSVVIRLNFLGGKPVEAPYDFRGQVLTVMYFILIPLLPLTNLWGPQLLKL